MRYISVQEEIIRKGEAGGIEREGWQRIENREEDESIQVEKRAIRRRNTRLTQSAIFQ